MHHIALYILDIHYVLYYFLFVMLHFVLSEYFLMFYFIFAVSLI